MVAPGYYSTDLELYYVTTSGKVLMVGSIDTDEAVWEPCAALPSDATPSDLDPAFAEELELSRIKHHIE